MSNLSRRTLVRGAAWSVPAVSIAAAAPAFAVSSACTTVSFTVTEDASNPANDKATFTFSGLPANSTVRFDSVTATRNTPTTGSINVVLPNGQLQANAAGILIVTANNNNSYVGPTSAVPGSATYTINFTITSGGQTYACTKSFTTTTGP